MAEESTKRSDDNQTAAGAAGTPNNGTAGAAAYPPYVFPETIPQHECDWLTNVEAKQKLDARCVGVKLDSDRKGSKLVRIALRLEPGQKVLSAVTNQIEDFGGTVAITTRYLSGGAIEPTMNTLRILGMDASKARAAYAQDAHALALAQQAKVLGYNDAKIEEAMTLLALSRGDLAACGLGSKVARIDSKNDVFSTTKGEEIVTRKVNWIEAIPAAVGADEVLGLVDLLGPSMRPPKPAAKSGGGAAPKGPTSPPPKAPSKPDDVDF